MTNEMSHSVFHFYSHSGTHIDNKLYIYNLVSSQVVPTIVYMGSGMTVEMKNGM
jgi:kynurenine formamidase